MHVTFDEKKKHREKKKKWKVDGDVCYRNKMNVFFYVWQNSDISIKLWVVELCFVEIHKNIMVL